MVIDVGADAIDRPSIQGGGYTVLSLDNPANDHGVIDMIEIFAKQDINDLIVGTFSLVNGTTYQCRDSELIGGGFSGSKHTFSGLDMEIEKGDIIGAWWRSGNLAADVSGYAGVMHAVGMHINKGDQAVYTLLDGHALSLCGIG